jgi:hypothetical protein
MPVSSPRRRTVVTPLLVLVLGLLPIGMIAVLHDVGKSALPDTLLNKPGRLDAAEWEFMRGRTPAGERIIRAAPALAHTADLVRSSHERFDGDGYPDRLAGDAIRSARASSPSVTRSTRWSPIARTATRCRPPTRSRSCASAEARSSTPT